MINYTHGRLFEDRDGNILAVEGSQNNNENILVNYIYLKDNKNGWIKIKNNKYIKVIKKPNGEWRNYVEQRRVLDEKVEYVESKIYPFIQLIPTSDIYNLTEPKKVLLNFIEEKQKKDIIKSALQELGISNKEEKNIGMIGSYQLGLFNDKSSDIDLIFYLDEDRNYEIFCRMQEIIKNGNELYGKGERYRINPLRFFHKNHEFCIHFSLPKNLIEKFNINEFEIGVPIEKEFKIDSIKYSIYTPTILKTTCNNYLIMYHGGDRGIFNIGDVLTISGRKYNNRIVVKSYERNMG